MYEDVRILWNPYYRLEATVIRLEAIPIMCILFDDSELLGMGGGVLQGIVWLATFTRKHSVDWGIEVYIWHGKVDHDPSQVSKYNLSVQKLNCNWCGLSIL